MVGTGTRVSELSARTLIKSAVDRYVPTLGVVYRELREKRRQSAPPEPTAFGFSFAGNSSIAQGVFEREQIAVFRKYLDRSSACIDIGAHIGLYTCLAASQGKYTISIEPLQSNLTLLYKNLLLNKLHGTEVLPLGLSSSPGLKILHGEDTGASFISGWAGMPAAHRQQLVPVTTLDLISRGRFDGEQLVIKVDVEGYELEVLKGAREVLQRRPKPYWLVEIVLEGNFPEGINRHYLETFEMFWSHGYECRTWGRGDVMVQPQDVRRFFTSRKSELGCNYAFGESGAGL